ncbi:TetR/AcrR family transcriptional regulator [Labedella populi]|uniref:TetR/AcrR family transcriptional regulator n=1 Tax=Labedella populi TaxID=2498850 RepID=A0A444QF47_9MICO|nr:TetR/AcrR family transcriptional regulator [Labedella populi]RWZ68138.1 TetR/AcrR family transcriptional regulator [Labedella populi]
MTAAETRDRVLEHATELFHREGYRAVGVDRLASAAGISKKTLYQLFRSKDDVLVAALEASREMAVADLPDEHDDRSVRQRLVAVFEAQLVYASRPEFSGCFFVNVATELRDPAHAAVGMAHLQKSELTKYVQRQAEMAGVEDSAFLAEQLTVLHTGAADYALLTGSYPLSVFAAVEALIDAAGIAK